MSRVASSSHDGHGTSFPPILFFRSPGPKADQVPRLFQTLASYRLPSGGTAYGRDERGVRPHANAWCHFFALEAWLFGSDAVIEPKGLLLT